MPSPAITIGLVAALPVESAATRLMIDQLAPASVRGDPNLYLVGRLPSRIPRHPHRVVLATQVHDGTRSAAAICANLARSFPDLRQIVLCGIAGGVPTDATSADLALGDIVTAAAGIVDYDHVRSEPGMDRQRRPVEGQSKVLLAADREIEAKELLGTTPWINLLNGGRDVPESFRRPLAGADPRARFWLSRRPTDGPRVHRAAIGSADRLVRDAATRDRLAARFGICAVEMEGSGVAVGADLHGLHWYVVRGVSDYCDATKNDRWQPYAAVAAAAYVRVLLGEVLPIGDVAATEESPARSDAGAATGLGPIVEALLALPVMQDDNQRRMLLALLPSNISTQVPSHQVARLHVIALVQTCERFPNGGDALLTALRLAMGTSAPELDRVTTVIRRHWRES